jgi:hypothetical protein
MNNMFGARAPGWFRVVAVLALLWSLFGVYIYLEHVGMVPPMKQMTPEEAALAASVPAWVKGAFALAVFGSLLGCIGLLLGKAWARALLILALVAVLVQMGWILIVSDARAIHGNEAFIMPVTVTVIALLLVWLADKGVKRGWLT